MRFLIVCVIHVLNQKFLFRLYYAITHYTYTYYKQQFRVRNSNGFSSRKLKNVAQEFRFENCILHSHSIRYTHKTHIKMHEELFIHLNTMNK